MGLSNLYKQKIIATIYRVFISLTLISIVLIPLYFLWYPYPLNQALNINHLIFIIIITDVGVAGFFTFLFFESSRKDNDLNMYIITFIQIIAFIVGFYFFVQVRPACLVQHQDRVYLMQPSSVIFPQGANKFEQLIMQPWMGPEFKSVKFSEEKIKRQTQLFQSVDGNGIEYQLLEYLPFDNGLALNYSQSTSTLLKFNTKNEIINVLEKYTEEAKRWLPLRSSSNGEDMVVLLNDKGEIIGIVKLKPW